MLLHKCWVNKYSKPAVVVVWNRSTPDSLNMNMETDVINVDPGILSGTPVFSGTRVPIETLFDHLESGVSLDVFLSDFPTVAREQAVQVLELAGKVVTSANFKEFYETTS